MTFKKGKSYFIRTVTYHLVGRVKEIEDNFITLEAVSWVANSGTFSKAINLGILHESEKLNVNAYVNKDAITDAFDWTHELPTENIPKELS